MPSAIAWVAHEMLTVRRLSPEDHEQWEALSVAFQKEMNLPVPGDREQRKAPLIRSSRLGHWFGGFDGARLVHDLERLFLFTGETNVAARQLYESLGFEHFGHFGLFFGEPVQR